MRRTARSKEAAATTRDVVALNHWLSVTRLRSAAAIALFSAVMWRFSISEVRWEGPIFVCLAEVAFSLFALRNQLGRRHPWPFFYVQTVVDIVGVTTAIATSVESRPETLFSMTYLLIIVPAALISVRGGLVAATLATLGHLFVTRLHAPPFDLSQSLATFLPVFLFYLVAQQCFFYAGQLERKNRALARLATRLETSRARLEDLIRIARTLNSTLDAGELLARSNRATLEQLRGEVAATFLVDAERQTFRMAATSEGRLDDSIFSRVDFPMAAFPSVARLERQAVVVLTPDEVTRIPTVMTGGARLASVYVGGLYRGDVLVGFVAIGYGEAEAPAAAEIVKQLGAIAEHSTIALGNAKLLEEAREASALKSEFLSTVSHELRTPLNVIIGYTEMLRDGAAGRLTIAQDELFQRIETSGRELFDLIDAVLQVGRLETGAATAVLAPVTLPALLKTIEGSLGGLPRPPHLSFSVDVPADLAGTLVTDAPKVGLVVRNLVGNAFKFTARGHVLLRVRALPGRLALEVEDTGSGIAPEHLPHIFEMFRQLHGSESRGGVGLGLHIVKQVMARLGGTVNVRSAPGEGSTFRIELPRWEAEGASASPVRASERAATHWTAGVPRAGGA